MIQRHQLFNSRFLLDHLLRVNDIISRRDAKFWGTMVGKEDDQYVSMCNAPKIASCQDEFGYGQLSFDFYVDLRLALSVEC